jgi:hypothetical protein
MASGSDTGEKRGIIPRSLSAISINKRERKLRSSVSDSCDDDSILPFVIEKVKKHPDFKEQSENTIQEAAQNFIDREYFKSLFSPFSEQRFIDSAARVGEEAEAELLRDGEETEVAALRSSRRLKEVCNIEVKLCLSKLDVWSPTVTTKFAALIEAQYGATHAALLIGNKKDGYLSFEWGDTSLIIPQFCETPECVFMAKIHSDFDSVHHRLDDQMQAAGRQLNYGDQVDLLFEATTLKSKLLDNLIELVLRYNKYYYFHSFSRNCQQFVTDALKALNIKKPHNFTGRLKEYFEQLKKGLPQKPPSFRSHAELDAHVQANIGGATPHDLEYFLCMYFHFHFSSRSQSGSVAQWRCEEESCQVANVEQRIGRANLVLSRYS